MGGLVGSYGWPRKVETLGRRSGRAGDLLHQSAEIRFFDHIQTTRAIFGGVTPLIEGVANEGAIATAIVGLDLAIFALVVWAVLGA